MQMQHTYCYKLWREQNKEKDAKKITQKQKTHKETKYIKKKFYTLTWQSDDKNVLLYAMRAIAYNLIYCIRVYKVRSE